MAKLVWDQAGQKVYETGTKKGVLYVVGNDGTYGKGVAWNGLTAITESPSGADVSDFYADDIKYASLRAAEDFGGTIEAYTYPDEWEQCDGTATLAPGVKVGQQNRKTFGLSYVTTVGNDLQGTEYGYKIHLVYGATASPSERAYATINDSPELITFSWEFTTVPVAINADGLNLKATALITIDSTDFKDEAAKGKLKALEDKIWGTDEGEAELPTPDEVYALLK